MEEENINCIHFREFTQTRPESCEEDVIDEIEGDVFTSQKSLAHCVSADLEMSKGIAKEFDERFGNKDVLHEQFVQPGGVAILDSLYHGGDEKTFVYYLVTKKKYFQKPKLHILRLSLECMRNHALKNNVDIISMPRIGTGLDKLDWRNVKQTLFEVFENTGIKIQVYSLPRQDDCRAEPKYNHLN